MALLIVVSSLVNLFRFSAGVGIGLFCSSGLFSDPSLSQLAGFWSGLVLVFVSLDVHISSYQVVLLVVWVTVTFFADFSRETIAPKAPRWLFDVLRRPRWSPRMWKQKTWNLQKVFLDLFQCRPASVQCFDSGDWQSSSHDHYSGAHIYLGMNVMSSHVTLKSKSIFLLSIHLSILSHRRVGWNQLHTIMPIKRSALPSWWDHWNPRKHNQSV